MSLSARDSRWAVVDVETTGLHPVRDRVVEVAVIRLDEDATPIDEWSTLVNPGAHPSGSAIHGITRRDFDDAPTFADIRDDLLARLSGSVIVAHNAPFDVAFLQAETIRAGVAWGPVEGLCTMEVLRELGVSKSRKLHQTCAELHLAVGREHVAIDDARAVAEILGYLAPRLWTLDTPPPAPAWPTPSVAPPTKPRSTPATAAPARAMGHHFDLPADLGVSDAASTTYLGLLDHVVEDGRVTAEEHEALALFAHACGISRDIARRLHIAYLEEMMRVARSDGVVSPAERTKLEGLVPLLSIALPPA